MSKLLRAALIGFGLAGSLVGAVFFSIAAHAADKGGPKSVFDDAPLAPAKSWSGVWVGANLGYAIATARGQECVLELICSETTGSTTGASLGGGVGLDVQAGKHFVFGVFGDYDILFDTKPKSDADGMWAVGARGGYLITPHVLAYGLIGYTQLRGVDDLNGLTLGAGVEAKMDLGWSLKLEYRHTDLGNHDAGCGLFCEANADTALHQVRLGLTYKFAGPQ